MTSHLTLDIALYERYLAGELAPEEARRVEQYFGESTYVHDCVLAMQSAAATRARPADPDQIVQSAFAGRYEYDAGEGQGRDELGRSTDTRREERIGRRSYSWSMYAARVGIVSAIFCVIFGIGMWAGIHREPSDDTFSRESVYSTPNGQRANVTLSDGSTVSLNVGSRLRVPSDFAKGNRVVHLDGEAMFSVLHHVGRPFTVIAGASATNVLGTRFAVRSYASDSSVTIAVVDGKVAVRRIDGTAEWNAVILSAQQQVEVSALGVSEPNRATEARFSFEDNRLIVDGKPIRNAIPELNRWYDADIRLGDENLGNARLVIEAIGNSLGDLQLIFERTLALRVVREGRVLTIYRR